MGEVRTPFDPAVHGFHFPNAFSTVLLPRFGWGPLRTPQIALGGLCGGMTFASLDHYFADRPIPTHTAGDYPPLGVPAVTSRLHDEIMRRHLSSVGLEPGDRGIPVPGQSLRVKPGDLYNLLQYPRLRMASASRLVSRLGDELDAAMASLAAGTPIPLGLVSTASLFESHQVVAVGYDDSVASGIRIFLYDCRNPDQTATLTVAPQGPACTLDVDGQASETWRAFFVERYSTSPPTYTDLALAAPVVVTELANGTAALRFTVRNSGDATAHATAVGVRAAAAEPAGEHGGRPADAAAPEQPLGDLAPAMQFAYDQSVPAGSSFGVAYYIDATGHEFELPSNG